MIRHRADRDSGRPRRFAVPRPSLESPIPDQQALPRPGSGAPTPPPQGPIAQGDGARLVQVFEQAPVAVVVVRGRIAADLVFELANPRYLEMLPAGRAPLGRRVGDVLPDMSDELLAALQGVLDTGEPFVANDYLLPLDRDGDGTLEQYYFSFVYHPLVEPDGIVSGVVGVGTEVTDTVRARLRAEESERRFRETADAAPVLMWTAGTDARCDWFNQPWLEFTGRPMEAELGDGWAERVHADDVDRCLGIYLGAFHARRPFTMEYRLQRHDGAYRWLLDNAVPRFASDDGKGDRPFVGYIGTCVDITDQRSAREEAEAARVEAEKHRAEAEAANATKSLFLSTMSHELRTPLNAIGGYTELLMLGLRGPLTEAQRQDLQRVRLANQHLTSLVTDILNFARLDAGQLELHVVDVDLASIMADLEPLLAPQLVAKRIGFDHDGCAPDTPDRPHRLRADPEKLRQILLNLLTNALKFTESGGHVALACTTDPAAGMIRVQVTDTGRGIPPHLLEHIFEPFVQIDRHRTHESQQGVGLGLAISRDLARRMGGDLTVASTPGVGSTFTLTLPTPS